MKHLETYCQRAEYELILRSFNEDIEVALCCKAQHTLSLFDKNNKIDDVRQDLANGIKNRHCDVCWRAEKEGVTSWRQIGNTLNYYNTNDLEIYLDRTCDLACVYCSQKYSSRWQQEIEQSSSEDQKLLNRILNDTERFAPSPKKINHVKRMLEEITNFGIRSKDRKLAQIMMLGGEPLLAPYVKKNIINDIVEAYYKKGNPNQPLKLVTVSNGNTPDHILDKTLNAMQELQGKYSNLAFSTSLSNESTGKLAEAIRYGLVWEQFIKNYKKYLSTGIPIGLAMTVNVLSYFDSANFVREMLTIAKDLDKKIFFRFNLCLYPEYLSVRMLPDGYQYIVDEIRNLLTEYEEQIYTPHIFYGLMDGDLKNLLQFYGTQKDKDKHFRPGVDYFNYLKRHRGTEIEKVNKKIYDYYMENYRE